MPNDVISARSQGAALADTFTALDLLRPRLMVRWIV